MSDKPKHSTTDFRQAYLARLCREGQSHPEVWPGTQSLDSFLSSGIESATTAESQKGARTYVAGRVQSLQPDRISIAWGETSSEFFWSSGGVDEPSKNLQCEPSWTQILREFDLVNLAIRPRAGDLAPNEIPSWEVVDLQLLVASEGEYFLRSGFTPDLAVMWNTFLVSVRGYFAEQNFTEYRTPTLVECPGTEPFLIPFRTKIEPHGTDVFLPTSPEWHLKKLLVAGCARVFEIRSCFRNEEDSPHHQPEFMMLEWYRAFANLDAIKSDVRRLFLHLGVREKIEEVSIADLFDQYCDFKLTPQTSATELRELARIQSVEFQNDDDFDTLFHRIFLEKIERKLGVAAPTIVFNYPPSQAALARLNQAGWADRMELYWHGLELANGFNELNDAEANISRLREDALKKQSLGFSAVGEDPEFIQAMKFGLPPSGGIALGLDRLFMALNGLQSIRQTRAFPR